MHNGRCYKSISTCLYWRPQNSAPFPSQTSSAITRHPREHLRHDQLAAQGGCTDEQKPYRFSLEPFVLADKADHAGAELSGRRRVALG